MMADTLPFQVPAYLNASTPAEYRGMKRDHVRLLTLDRVTGENFHHYFYQLDSILREGDLLVLNNSRTLPAVLQGRKGEQPIEIRLSRKVTDQEWEALILGDVCTVGEKIYLPGEL